MAVRVDLIISLDGFAIPCAIFIFTPARREMQSVNRIMSASIQFRARRAKQPSPGASALGNVRRNVKPRRRRHIGHAVELPTTKGTAHAPQLRTKPYPFGVQHQEPAKAHSKNPRAGSGPTSPASAKTTTCSPLPWAACQITFMCSSVFRRQ